MFNLNYYAFAACMQLTHEKDYTGFLGGGWRDQMRKGIFVQQNEAIKQHNSRKSSSYRRELNTFSDMVQNKMIAMKWFHNRSPSEHVQLRGD